MTWTSFIMAIKSSTLLFLMLISLISLAAMGTIQKNISTKVRPVGLINNYKGIIICAAIYESGLLKVNWNPKNGFPGKLIVFFREFWCKEFNPRF